MPWICALTATSLVWLSGSLGTSASAELPMTGDPVLREAQHAETHAEPSDEDLEKIARMPRSVSPSDLEPNPSVSVGYPNRGLLRFGMRINDDKDLEVKVGSQDSRHGNRRARSLDRNCRARSRDSGTRARSSRSAICREPAAADSARMSRIRAAAMSTSASTSSIGDRRR